MVVPPVVLVLAAAAAGAGIAIGAGGRDSDEPITRFICKVKMSQDKDRTSQLSVLEQLRGDGPYASPALAADMERALANA